MDNTGLRLRSGPKWPYGHSSFTDLLERRPEDCVLISNHKFINPIKLVGKVASNQYRQFMGHWINDLINQRYIWREDKRVFGTREYWVSLYAGYYRNKESDKSSVPLGDCEDVSLCWLEWMLDSSVEPRHLYLLTALSFGEQRKNARRPKNERIPSNHVMGGVMDENGDLWCIDSNLSSTDTVKQDHVEFRKTQDTNYQWHIWNNLADPPGDWYEVETYPETPSVGSP